MQGGDGLKLIKMMMIGISIGQQSGQSAIYSIQNQVWGWLIIKLSITFLIIMNSLGKIWWSKIWKGIENSCKKMNIILPKIRFGVGLVFIWNLYLLHSLFQVKICWSRLICYFSWWVSEKSQYNMDRQAQQQISRAGHFFVKKNQPAQENCPRGQS